MLCQISPNMVLLQYMSKKLDLTTVLHRIADDKKLLAAFLDDLLTPKEREEFERRWEIIERLQSGETQRTIASDLGVGIATVTRGSRELADAKGGFAQVLKFLEGKK